MKAKTNIVENYQVIINWLDRNLETELAQQIHRQVIVDECDVPMWLVAKSLLMLDRKKYIIRTFGTLINSYTKTPALKNLNPELLQSWVIEYTHEAQEASREKKASTPVVATVPPDPKPMTIDFSLAVPCSPATIEAKQKLDEAFADYKYGFLSTDGPKWFKSVEEAADQATVVAFSSGLTHIDIVQKVGKVINQPTVTFFN